MRNSAILKTSLERELELTFRRNYLRMIVAWDIKFANSKNDKEVFKGKNHFYYLSSLNKMKLYDLVDGTDFQKRLYGYKNYSDLDHLEKEERIVEINLKSPRL